MEEGALRGLLSCQFRLRLSLLILAKSSYEPGWVTVCSAASSYELRRVNSGRVLLCWVRLSTVWVSRAVPRYVKLRAKSGFVGVSYALPWPAEL